MAEVLKGVQRFEFIEYRVLKAYDLLDRDVFNRALADLEGRFVKYYSF
jgi:hypothetical protein